MEEGAVGSCQYNFHLILTRWVGGCGGGGEPAVITQR